MSIKKTTYVIAGYDLTNYVNDKYKDWRWTDEGESYTCNKIKGNIQLFDDPMNGDSLYLGYIFTKNDEYCDFYTEMIDPEKISKVMSDVVYKLLDLESKGIISKCPKLQLDYKIIIFDEWS